MASVGSTASYKVCYANPCLDPAYTEISGPSSLANYDYTITDGERTETVPAFTLVTRPDATHGLCGDIKYEFKVDGKDVPTTPAANDPVAFDPDGPRLIKIDSSDPAHVGTKTYTVTASLQDYPNASLIPDAEAEGEIEFISPCSLEGEV